jgi:hypothetical protein
MAQFETAPPGQAFLNPAAYFIGINLADGGSMPTSISGMIAMWTYLIGYWSYLFLEWQRGRGCPLMAWLKYAYIKAGQATF